jgi:hypothetical protein
MKKTNLIFFITIILIILVIIIIITVKSKDKYVDIDNSEKDLYIYDELNEIEKQKLDKQELDKQDKNIGCDVLVSPEDIYEDINGKLKGTYFKAARFDAKRKPDGTYGYDNIYIAFMPDFDSEAIPRIYNTSSPNIGEWTCPKNGKKYLLVKSEQNIGNLYGVPDGYSILDPLEKEFIFSPITIKESIKKIVRERWQPFINLPLIFMDDDPDFEGDSDEMKIALSTIRISFNPKGGSNSTIGKQCLLTKNQDKNTMNFAWFDVRTVIHEFGHMLGMLHEHQSPLSPIPNDSWDEPELYKYYDPTFKANGILTDTAEDMKKRSDWIAANVFKSTISVDKVEGSYDMNSIMFYSFPKKVFKDGTPFKETGIRLNCILSLTDAGLAAKYYTKYNDDGTPIKPNMGDIISLYKSIYEFSQ